MSRQFYIRCDASPTIGVGHFMRTCCLARALRQKHSVCFVMAATTPMVETVLRDEGIPLLRLNADISMAEEPLVLASQLGNQLDSTIIVDHYGATPRYLNALRESARALGVVDDLADRDLTAADWVHNQNLGAEALPYKTRPGCRLLLGTRYCLLRPQFAVARQEQARRFSVSDNRVLITLGGGSMFPFIVEILTALENVRQPLALRVIIAGDAESLEDARTRFTSTRHTLEILHNVTNMAEQMAWADLAVTAGGSTTWELCTLGVPMIVVPLSHDQVPNAARLEKAGCATRILPQAIAEHLGPLVADFLRDPERRARISAKGQALVDGLGAQRVAAALEEVCCVR